MLHFICSVDNIKKKICSVDNQGYLGEQIVLQDSLDDDSSTGNVPERPDNETPTEDFRGGDVAEEDTEYFDGFPQAYDVRKRDPVGRRMPFVNSGHDNLPDGDGISSFPPEAPVQNSGSKGQTSVYPSGNFGTSYDERYEISLG